MIIQYNTIISTSKIIIIWFILTLIIIFIYIHYNIKYIRTNWSKLKCVPYYSPFAGFIFPKKGENKFTTGMNNMNKCLWVFAKRYFTILIKPITYIISIITKLLNQISNTLDTFRQQLIVIRKMLMEIVKQVMERLENLLLIFMQTFFKLRDTTKKSMATFKLFTYMLKTSSLTLQSFINGPVGDVAKLGAELGYMMTYFLLGPISFKMFPSLWLPILCFDPNTHIKDKNGIFKPISNINIGDILWNNNKVKGIYKFLNLSNIQSLIGSDIVSNNHIILDNNLWKCVGDIKYKKSCKKYPTFLNSLSVSKHHLYTKNNIYRDWDEIDDIEIELKYKNIIGKILNKQCFNWDKKHLYPNVFFFKSNYLKTLTKLSLGQSYNNSIIIGKSICYDKNIKWYKHLNYDSFYVSGSNIVKEDNLWIPVYLSKQFIQVNSNINIGIHFVTLSGILNIEYLLFRDLLEVRCPKYECNYRNDILNKLNTIL